MAGHVLFTFDDLYLNAYTNGMQYMMSKSPVQKGTVYVTNSYVGLAAHLTEAELAACYAAGWDLGAHGSDHTVLGGLSQDDVISRGAGCMAYLEGKGWTRGAKHYAYPIGATVTYPPFVNTIVRDALRAVGFLTGRGTAPDSNLGIADGFLCTAQTPRMTLHHVNLGSSFSLATAKTYIDNATAAGSAVIFLVHEIVAAGASGNQWTTADFQALVDYAIASGSALRTISEWWALVNPGPESIPRYRYWEDARQANGSVSEGALVTICADAAGAVPAAVTNAAGTPVANPMTVPASGALEWFATIEQLYYYSDADPTVRLVRARAGGPVRYRQGTSESEPPIVVSRSTGWDTFAVDEYGRVRTSHMNLAVYGPISPAVVSAGSVHAAIALTADTQVVTTGITSPDVYRNVFIIGNRVGQTGNVVIDGLDWWGNPVSETIAISGTSWVVGSIVFKRILSITVPPQGAGGDTVSVGIGSKFGLPVPYLDANTDVVMQERAAAAATAFTMEAVGTVTWQPKKTGITIASITAGDRFIWHYWTRWR